MRKIEKDGVLFALHFGEEDIPAGLGFFTGDDEFLQVGTWRYDAGRELAAHNHHLVPRDINRTQEFIWVVRGSLTASVFDEDDRPLAELTVKAGEGMIQFAGGHGYKILDHDTKVIEVKNGPYPGADVDRRRL